MRVNTSRAGLFRVHHQLCGELGCFAHRRYLACWCLGGYCAATPWAWQFLHAPVGVKKCHVPRRRGVGFRAICVARGILPLPRFFGARIQQWRGLRAWHMKKCHALPRCHVPRTLPRITLPPSAVRATGYGHQVRALPLSRLPQRLVSESRVWLFHPPPARRLIRRTPFALLLRSCGRACE